MTGAEADRAPVASAADPLQSPTKPVAATPAVAAARSSADAASLATLAREGQWKAVVERTNAPGQAGALPLGEAAWRVAALAKLRNYAAAAEALAALGDLDGPQHCVETPHGTQSRVPFALRLLACELPARQGQWRESQDAFYCLLDHCRQQAEAGLSGAEAQQDAAYRALWRQREERIAASLFGQHLRLREYRTALDWLGWLRQRRPDCLALLATLGCTQLVIGHTRAAAETFQALEQLRAQAGPAAEAEPLTRLHQGLLLFCQGDFAGAAAEFDAAATADPADAAAVSNRAVCRMYGGELTAAIQALEEGLQRRPEAMLREPVLANLSGMYELLAPALGQASKKNLAAWAARSAPQEFDLACLR